MIEQDASIPGPLIEPDRPSRIVARNTSVLLLRQVANWLIVAVLVLLVPRYLGDVGLGQLQFGQSFAALVSIGVGLGMSQMLTREIARDRQDAAALISTAMTVRLVSSVIAIGVVAIVSWLSNIRGEAAAVVYLSTGAVLLMGLGRVGVSVLHGKEEMSRVAMADAISRLIAAGIGVAVLLSGRGVVEYAATVMVGAAIYSTIVLIFSFRELPVLPGFSRVQAKRLLTGSMPFAITAGILTLYGQADSIMIRAFSGEAVLGWYSAALRLVGATEILPAVIATALLPTLARTHLSDRPAAASLGRRAVAVAAALVVPVAFVLAANAYRLVDFLPIPEVFENASPVLVVLAISIPVTATLTIVGAIAAGSDRQKIFMTAIGTGLLLNLALNAILIPMYQRNEGNGGTGAAVATLISEVVILVIVARVMSAEAFGRDALLSLGRVTVAAGAMVSVAWLGNEANIHWSLWNVAALAIYAALIPLLKVITRSDVELIWESVKRRRKRPVA